MDVRHINAIFSVFAYDLDRNSKDFEQKLSSKIMYFLQGLNRDDHIIPTELEEGMLYSIIHQIYNKYSSSFTFYGLLKRVLIKRVQRRNS